MRLYVFSGAGLSAESGIATFRTGENPTWDGHDIRRVCWYPTWRQNYDEVHAFYNKRRMQLASVRPNAAHRMLAEWQSRYETRIITQNVDDLLERAGCTDVLHLHGNLTRLRCLGCRSVWDVGYKAFVPGTDHCPSCGSTRDIKPAVIFFHEDAEEYETFEAIRRRVRIGDAFVVIGTSGFVIDIASMVKRMSCTKILCNLEPSPDLDESVFKHVFFKPATAAVRDIDAILRQGFGH
jgi:NAD-dependent deacetylase